ncbi:MAG: metallopeptidase TldD-related protein [Thermoplasmata archaeon]
MRAFIGKDASGHATASSTSLAKFKPELVGRTAGEIAKMAKGPKNAECGKMDVLFYPLAFAGLLNEVASASSAFNVDAGFSFLRDRLGKKIASENFTLYDDGTLEEGIFSSPFDDEGFPTRRNEIIEKGVVKSYLHNTSTAKKWNTERTGNAGLIRPHPWNIVMDIGDFSRAEMIKSLDKGLIVTNIWYTRYQDYESGDFSTIPRDGIFLVKNGKIDCAVKGIRISDNLPRLLSSIEMIGKNKEQIHWWEVEIPTFCSDVVVKDVKITKSTD